jgi:hypothetical protein
MIIAAVFRPRVITLKNSMFSSQPHPAAVVVHNIVIVFSTLPIRTLAVEAA